MDGKKLERNCTMDENTAAVKNPQKRATTAAKIKKAPVTNVKKSKNAVSLAIRGLRMRFEGQNFDLTSNERNI